MAAAKKPTAGAEQSASRRRQSEPVAKEVTRVVDDPITGETLGSATTVTITLADGSATETTTFVEGPPSDPEPETSSLGEALDALGDLGIVLASAPDDQWGDLIEADVQRMRRAKDGVTWVDLEHRRIQLWWVCEQIRQERAKA